MNSMHSLPQTIITCKYYKIHRFATANISIVPPTQPDLHMALFYSIRMRNQHYFDMKGRVYTEAVSEIAPYTLKGGVCKFLVVSLRIATNSIW